MKLTPINFDPFDTPARRIARAEGGMALQRTAPFPDAPEGYEFYGPTDEPAKEKDFIPGVGSEGVQAYSPEVQENAAPSALGTAATNIADWYKNQPSWMEQAGQQTQKDIDAYTQGGPGAMFDDTQGTQDLAGGFAGSTTPVARAASEIAQPFYSAVSKAIAETPQPKASGEQWAATLRNRPGVKSEEMEWTGLEDWLKEQKGPVSKQQIADYIRANQIEVKEVMKGARTPLTDGERQELATLDQRFAERDMTLNNDDAGRAAELRMKQDQLPDAFSPTKHSKWQMPGGENYREMLLTLPTKNQTYDVFSKELKTKYGDQPFSKMPLTEKERTKLDALMEDSINETDEGAGKFKSSHFDEPNVLAHIRFNDRMIDGKKTLFVEEVQSDWHQKGKREGYKFDTEKRLEELTKEWGDPKTSEARKTDIVDEMNRLHDVNRAGVPDAPFKTTWPELAMKRIIRYAAENGYDKVAWTPGDVQAARYDLSKHIDNLRWFRNGDGTYRIRAEKDGNVVLRQDKGISENELANTVGKELAEKIVKNEEQNGALTGLDLKVGGEGMKGFYDQILPAAANKLVKKHGVKVGKAEMPIKGSSEEFNRRPTEFPDYESWLNAKTEARRPKTQQVHQIDITPSLRKSAMEQGFPQFASGGRVEPSNIDHNPTEAQKEAGNYAKDHVRIHGLDLTIENAKNKNRSGVGKDGKPWSVKMPAHYGYIKRTEGADGDHVDCYIGPHIASPHVFIVNQVDADKKEFDEHKCMIGFGSKNQAIETYKKGFSDGRGHERIGHVTEMNIDAFKRWLKNGDMDDPAKVTKASVGYSKGMPKSHCGICVFYRDATCSKVQGEIAPAMWCRLFKKKHRADGGPVVDDDEFPSPEGISDLGGIGSTLKRGAQSLVSGVHAAGDYLGIPQGEIRNAQGDVVFPTNELERGLQKSDEAGSQYAAAVMGPGSRGPIVGIGGPTRAPELWHGISTVKLRKPISEMQADISHTPVPEKNITPADLEGGWLMPAFGDRSAAAGTLTGIGETKLVKPVDLQGGHGYMPANTDRGVVWASGPSVISGIENRAAKLGASGDPVYFPYTAMGERSVDFSHHVSDALTGMLPSAKISGANKSAFNMAMKTAGKDFGAVEDWPGIGSKNLREYLATAPGAVRNKFAKTMDTARFQNSGFPSVAEARFSVTDPRLLNAETGDAGLSISRIATGSPRGEAAHRTYETALPGEYVGGFGTSVPKEAMYPDITNAIEAYRNKFTGFKPTVDYLMSRTPKGLPIAQRATPQWVDTMSELLRSKGLLPAVGAVTVADILRAAGDKNEHSAGGAVLTPVDHNPFMPKPRKPVVEAKPPVALLPPPKPNKAAGGAVTAPPITYDAANRVVQELRSGGRVKPMADEPDKAPIEAIPDPIPEKVEQVPERPPEKPVDKPAEPSVMEQLLGKMIEVLQEQKKEFANLAIAVAAPKKLVRDENNNITGSETVLPKEEPKSDLNVVVEKE